MVLNANGVGGPARYDSKMLLLLDFNLVQLDIAMP
jgi:hypothetical protein